MSQLFGSCTMLAGGKSTRMGRDKELISDNTASILHELEALFPQIIVSTKNPSLYEGGNILPVADILPDCGPLGGIFTALCLSESQYLFVLPCDMPNIGRQVIGYMLQRTEAAQPDVCLACSERGLEPLVGFYSRSLLEDMRDFLLGGGRKLQTFLEKKNCLIIEAAEWQQLADNATFANYNHRQQEAAEGSPLVAAVSARRFNNEGESEIAEAVVREQELQLYCNGQLCEALVYSPSAEKELLLGRLYTFGLIRSAADLQGLKIENGRAFAEVRGTPYRQGDTKIAGQSEAGGESSKCFTAGKLISLSAEFLSRSRVFEKTGGVHSAAVSDGERLLCFFEDIGRFNAVDKCIGFCLLHGVDMRQSALYTSGRVACEMAEKAVAAAFPLLVSRAAPTDRAIERAKEAGLSLIAFARNGRFNMYCGYERVVR